MLVIRLARVCVLAGEMFNWKIVRYLSEGSRSCVHGVVILSSTFLPRVVGMSTWREVPVRRGVIASLNYCVSSGQRAAFEFLRI